MNTLNRFWDEFCSAITFGAFANVRREFSAGMLNTGELIVVDVRGHVQIFDKTDAQTIKQVLG